MTQRLLLSCLLALAVGSVLRAQDEAIFNHYVQNPIILNPAAAGFDDEYRVQLNARAAWSGFEDSPKTLGIRVNGPIGNAFGIGAALFTESAAQQRRLKGQVDVAFRFGFGPETRGEKAFQAGFGFFTQFSRFSLDGSVLMNPQFVAGDDQIMAMIDGDNSFDAGLGFYGSYLKNTFGGITINNLVSNRLENISGTVNNNGINYTFLLGQHFDVEELKVRLTPSLMMRNVEAAPFMLDFNLQAGFDEDKFIAGLSYRYLGAMGILLGTKLNGFQLFYSYDVSFGGFQEYHNGSHEFTVGYVIDRNAIRVERERKAQEDRRRRR